MTQTGLSSWFLQSYPWGKDEWWVVDSYATCCVETVTVFGRTGASNWVLERLIGIRIELLAENGSIVDADTHISTCSAEIMWTTKVFRQVWKHVRVTLPFGFLTLAEVEVTACQNTQCSNFTPCTIESAVKTAGACPDAPNFPGGERLM